MHGKYISHKNRTKYKSVKWVLYMKEISYFLKTNFLNNSQIQIFLPENALGKGSSCSDMNQGHGVWTELNAY